MHKCIRRRQRQPSATLLLSTPQGPEEILLSLDTSFFLCPLCTDMILFSMLFESSFSSLVSLFYTFDVRRRPRPINVTADEKEEEEKTDWIAPCSQES